MSRPALDPLGLPSPLRPSDPMVDLDRLLSRLQQTYLRADAVRERRLRTSEYEREKAGANIDYAATLLTRVEHLALGIKAHARRQEVQADLNRKRDLLGQVRERLRDFEDLSRQLDEDDASSEGDEMLSDILAAPGKEADPTCADLQAHDKGGHEDRWTDTQRRLSLPAQPQTQRLTQETVEAWEETTSDTLATTTTSANLWQRGHGPTPSESLKQPQALNTANTTGATTQRALLLGNLSRDTSEISAKEAMLDRERRAQEEITDAMSKLTRELKLSSIKFSEALEEDKEVTGQAVQGLNQAELNMQRAARTMAVLTRMTEGKGWWGRILLYAWVYGLMIVLILIVFVLPKLRI